MPRIALVVSRFNDFVTNRLRGGALAALEAAGVTASDVTMVDVPGAFEIPLAAQHAAESGRFDAIVCLGCVIRGETPHFEYISSAVAHGVMTAGAATGVPMAFGVLTTDTVDQAERAAVYRQCTILRSLQPFISGEVAKDVTNLLDNPTTPFKELNFWTGRMSG